ncbi:hypothetical protein DVH24_006777 [Malus domestica]|uniref:Uncharacterized protein n=1 Tax=Malus domestica TaxID=3750 RepID=A0A498JAK5_MALDO|nr:hypothetical protein DVH24_006777 [Malus domestica]
MKEKEECVAIELRAAKLKRNRGIKYSFIDDIEKDELQQWNRCDNLVKTGLLSSSSKEIVASVFYCDRVQVVWNKLYKHFSQDNSVQLYHIENEIHDCVQGTMSVGSYLTKLKGLWDENDILCLSYLAVVE